MLIRIASNCSDQVYCEAVNNSSLPQQPHRFKVAYDKLVIAAGAEPLTFGIKGVKEHAFFLREVNHAQEIRKKLLLNLMLSENPGELIFFILFSRNRRRIFKFNWIGY